MTPRPGPSSGLSSSGASRPTGQQLPRASAPLNALVMNLVWYSLRATMPDLQDIQNLLGQCYGHLAHPLAWRFFPFFLSFSVFFLCPFCDSTPTQQEPTLTTGSLPSNIELQYSTLSNLVLWADARFIKRRTDEATGDPKLLRECLHAGNMGANAGRDPAPKSKKRPQDERGSQKIFQEEEQWPGSRRILRSSFP
ncbi:hypothetical protein PG990_006972 [Apiospora arundinis]